VFNDAFTVPSRSVVSRENEDVYYRGSLQHEFLGLCASRSARRWPGSLAPHILVTNSFPPCRVYRIVNRQTLMRGDNTRRMLLLHMFIQPYTDFMPAGCVSDANVLLYNPARTKVSQTGEKEYYGALRAEDINMCAVFATALTVILKMSHVDDGFMSWDFLMRMQWCVLLPLPAVIVDVFVAASCSVCPTTMRTAATILVCAPEGSAGRHAD
jgi:hypothetical protein